MRGSPTVSWLRPNPNPAESDSSIGTVVQPRSCSATVSAYEPQLLDSLKDGL
jgi:hypothetical protein